MACYECGSDQGDTFKLCPSCIAAKQASRQSYRREFRDGYQEGTSDRISSIIHSRIAWIVSCVVLANICFVYFLFAGPFVESGPLASLFFALAVTFALISSLIWGFFLTRLFAFEFGLGVFSLFCPILAYRIVFWRWEDSVMRILFVAHFALIMLSYLMCIALADHLGIGARGVILVMKNFLMGSPIPTQDLLKY